MNGRTKCKGSAKCAVYECRCPCRKGDRFAMCRCCEARLTDAERAARTGAGWVDLLRKLGLQLGPNLLDYWEAFNTEMLLIVGAQLHDEQDPSASVLEKGVQR